MIVTVYTLAQAVSDMLKERERYQLTMRQYDFDQMRLQEREVKVMLKQVEEMAKKVNEQLAAGKV